MKKADKELLEDAREKLKNCVSDEEPERRKMLDDLAFCTLDQWDATIRNARENDPNGARPCLTIDKINQYIVQVVNDFRQNRPAVKVRPVDDKADVDTAKILQGLVRHIEEASDASIAYETALESAVQIGVGYFRIGTRYTGSGNEQEIYVGRIPNSFTVYLSPHVMPDGSDSKFGFIVEYIPVEDFKKEHPGKKFSTEDFAELEGTSAETFSWRAESTIAVCEYFYCEYDYEEIDGISQKTNERIRWCKFTGLEVLQKTDWPGKYIPIVEVVGREAHVRGRRVLWGLVRPAKDSLRMNNYWMSAITEKIGLAPKIPFIGAKGQFSGLEDQWKKANTENRPYLEYDPIDVNGNALPPPARVAPALLEVAMVNMTSLIERDVKASLGMYKAAVGDSESQQSGRAILALQKESDTGTFHFQDNGNRSVKHAGRIIVDLIPKIYDTRRVVRIIGEDGEAQAVTLDPEQPQSSMKIREGDKVRQIYNPGVGTFDVAITTGPSYTTARQEAATILTELANSAKDPASAAVMRYLAVKNSDFHGSDEMTRMLKALLPPALQQDPNNPVQIPPQVQAQMQQMQQMMQLAAQKIQELESGEKTKMAKVEVDAKEAAAKLRLAQEEADREAKIAIYKANKEAETKVRVAQIQADCKMREAGLSADTDMSIAFMTGEREKQIADADRQIEVQNANADRGADIMLQSAQMGQDRQLAEQEMAIQPEGQAPAAPQGNMRDMMSGMMQLMANIADDNQKMMQMHEQTMLAIAQMVSNPPQRKVTMTLPSTGKTVTATVN
jgi:hypothetical protein